ncbi:MAG: FmdB family transcriptional regulator [Planctomycetota bacterium]
MPIYEYEHNDGACGTEGQPNRFDRLESFSATPLTECPVCKAAVHRILSVPSRPGKDILSSENLTAKGFTQYTKRDTGVYERTAGTEGPSQLIAPPED